MGEVIDYMFMWTCHLHGVTGRGDDTSLRDHEKAEHNGATIAVMVTRCVGPGNTLVTFERET